jgi:hypothetical protein
MMTTMYRGCCFPSPLEAKWAMFFDALHVRWSSHSRSSSLQLLVDGLAAAAVGGRQGQTNVYLSSP